MQSRRPQPEKGLLHPCLHWNSESCPWDTPWGGTQSSNTALAAQRCPKLCPTSSCPLLYAGLTLTSPSLGTLDLPPSPEILTLSPRCSSAGAEHQICLAWVPEPEEDTGSSRGVHSDSQGSLPVPWCQGVTGM